MQNRYEKMEYRRCGNSGIKLPAVALGLWHNFGSESVYENARKMLCTAFDLGINHLDLANNYGPLAGSAEETLGRVMKSDLGKYRDELLISTKAGYYMWEGPYGEWGSKKNLIASIDQSLKRMNLEYVDIFYHHRPDPNTPISETAEALEQIVRCGKALYVGLSNYNPTQTVEMVEELRRRNVPCLLHQMSYSMLNRVNEPVIDVLDELNIGSIAFSPLAQGLLTERYMNGIPEDSRAATSWGFLKKESVTPEVISTVKALDGIAKEREQSLSQMALAWVLRRTTSVIIGASRPSQIVENTKAIENLEFTIEEIDRINNILGES